MYGISYNNKSVLEKLDDTPTSGSSNAVKSDGVKAYVDITAGTVNDSLATERQARIDGDAQLGARITDVEATQTADTFVFKGSVTAISNLPAASGATIGDTYYVEAEHCNYSCYQSGSTKAWTQSSGTDLNQMKDNIATDWQNTHATKIYKAGDIVMYNDKTYVRKSDATTYDSVWDSSEWIQMSVGDQVSKVNNVLRDTFQCLGYLSIQEIGYTPDDVPAKQGYYISAPSTTRHYTGVESRSIFYVYLTPNNAIHTQEFILTDGRIFGRYSNTGEFTSGIDATLTESKKYADAKVTGDAIFALNRTIGDNIQFVETHTGVFVGRNGKLVENENYNVHDYNVSDINNLNIVCNTTLYGSSTYWAFLDKENVVVSQGHGQETGKYAYQIETVVPVESVIFRVTEHAVPLVNFSIGITDLSRSISNLYESNKSENSSILYDSSPTATISGASDSTGGVLNFYLPYSSSSNEYIKVAFIHSTRPEYDGTGNPTYHNGDVFRLEQGIIGHVSNGVFSPRKTAIVSGAWEAAIYKNNTGSAVGTFHGWEKFSRCIIQADGETIADLNPNNSDLPEIQISSAYKFDILYWSEVYELPAQGVTTEIKLLDAFRKYHIENNIITLTQRNTWIPSGTHGIFVGMGCLSRELTKYAICDYDYVLYDISNGNETPISNSVPDVSYAREFGTETGVAMTMTVDPPCNFRVQNTIESAEYNKLYFRYIQETESGGIWNNETVFILG